MTFGGVILFFCLGVGNAAAVVSTPLKKPVQGYCTTSTKRLATVATQNFFSFVSSDETRLDDSLRLLGHQGESNVSYHPLSARLVVIQLMRVSSTGESLFEHGKRISTVATNSNRIEPLPPFCLVCRRRWSRSNI